MKTYFSFFCLLFLVSIVLIAEHASNGTKRLSTYRNNAEAKAHQFMSAASNHNCLYLATKVCIFIDLANYKHFFYSSLLLAKKRQGVRKKVKKNPP